MTDIALLGFWMQSFGAKPEEWTLINSANVAETQKIKSAKKKSSAKVGDRNGDMKKQRVKLKCNVTIKTKFERNS